MTGRDKIRRIQTRKVGNGSGVSKPKNSITAVKRKVNTIKKHIIKKHVKNNEIRNNAVLSNKNNISTENWKLKLKSNTVAVRKTAGKLRNRKGDEMLAQLNTKQKLFFNTTPTVIDKLISKNKSSILNRQQLQCLDDSDDNTHDSKFSGSLENETSSSDKDSDHDIDLNTTQLSRGSLPKKCLKNQVTNSKTLSQLSAPSGMPLKRRVGRPKKHSPDNVKLDGSSSKIHINVPTKKTRKIIKRVIRKKEISIEDKNKEGSHAQKRKEDCVENTVNNKICANTSSSDKTLKQVKKFKTLLHNTELVNVEEDVKPSTNRGFKHSSRGSFVTKKVLRKFPVNNTDRWKCGMSVRGQGRGRGRGRGGKSGPYVTRSDSPIRILRNGKKRKYSDPYVLEGLDVKKRRRLVSEILSSKIEYPSDEQSSFMTDSEFSVYEASSTPKRLEGGSEDDENVKTEHDIKIKYDNEMCKGEIKTTDTNSNIFKSDISDVNLNEQTPIKSGSLAKAEKVESFNDKVEKTEYKNDEVNDGEKKKEKLNFLFEPGIRDSDGSFDSDVTEDSNSSQKTTPQKKNTRQKKTSDGMWVRRSIRSVGNKNPSLMEPVIQELLKEKDFEIKRELDDTEALVYKDENETTKDFMFKDLKSPEKSKDNDTSGDTSTDPSTDFILILEDSPVKSDNTEVVDTPCDELNTSQRVLEHDNTTNRQDITLLNQSSVEETSSAVQISHCVNDIKNNESSEERTSSEHDTEQSEKSICPDDKIIAMIDSFCESNNLSVENETGESANKNSAITENATDLKCIDDLPVQLNNKNQQYDEELYIHKEDVSSTGETEIDVQEQNTFDKENTGQTEIHIESDGDQNKAESVESTGQTADCDSDNFSCTKPLTITDISAENKIIISTPNIKLEECTDNELNSDEMFIDDKTDIDVEPETQSLEEIIELKSCFTSNENLEDNLDTGHVTNSFDNVEETSRNKEDTLEENYIKNEKDHDIRSSVESAVIMDIEEEIHDKEDMKTSITSEESLSNYSDSQLMEFDTDTKIDIVDNVSECLNQPSLNYNDEPNSEETNCNGNQNELISDSQGKNSITSEDLLHKILSEENKKTEEKVDDNKTETKPSLIQLKLKSSIVESAEERANKESILNALGLQSLKSVNEEKPKHNSDNYTGTLKAVIKLNRCADKRSGGRKMIFKQSNGTEDDPGGGGDRLEYRICSEPEISTDGVPLTHLGDVYNRKSLTKPPRTQHEISPNGTNVSNTATGGVECSSSEAKEGTSASGGKQSSLVIPEKSSSFSIHPGRLCSDVCSYCFGKFGSLDTPCHLAQLKNAERLTKILTIETHLAMDSCLCDGCYRYVDRKANCPSANKAQKPQQKRGPLSGTSCSVQGCSQPARHSVRRKWLIKLKKSISKKLVIDMDKTPHLPFPLCSQHYYWVDYFTVCGICKKRLTRNHMYALGPEANELNSALSDDGIPVRLSDKLFLCKLCRYYSSLRLKYRDPSQMTAGHKLFFRSYRKKILQYHDIPVSDSEEEGKTMPESDPRKSPELPKVKKKKSKSKSLDISESTKKRSDKSLDEKPEATNSEKSSDSQMVDYSYLESLGVSQDIPSTPTVDYSTLGDFDSQGCSVGFSNIASLLNPLESGQGTVYPADNQSRSRVDVKPTRIQVKFGNLNIGKLSNLNIGQDSRPGQSPGQERPPYLPGERKLQLGADFEFHGHSTPNSSWERCTSTIQFDRDTKKMWQELQRPYGNQSSFLRHLVMLEKHWRTGSLVLAENADSRAVKYITSVTNRVYAYESGTRSSSKLTPPLPSASAQQPQPSASQQTPPSTRVLVINKSDPGSRANTPVMRPVVSSPSTSALGVPGLVEISQCPPSWKKDQPRQLVYGQVRSLNPGTISHRMPSMPKPSSTVSIRHRKPNSQSLIQTKVQTNSLPLVFHQFKQKPPPPHEKNITQSQNHDLKMSSQGNSQQSPNTTSSSESFVPLICDVRSLASPGSSSWNENFKVSDNQSTSRLQQQQKKPIQRYYTPILPKIPKALTVTQIVQPSLSPVMLRNTSLTIEKAPIPTPKQNKVLCQEKPSISVFREPTPNDGGI